MIEIWSAVWFSTSILWESMCLYNPYGEIVSREISYPHYRQSLINTSSYKNIRVFLWNFCHYPLDNILRKWSYDMIFIDGRKSETLLYLTKLLPYIHQTTRIIIDDVIKFKSKMTDCYDFLDKNNIEYTVHHIDQDDGILIIPESKHLITALSSL
jgi:predicted O-methyltransferase YrrM